MNMKKILYLLVGIEVICISGYAEAKPSVQCPLDAKVKKGQCVCSSKRLYGNGKSEEDSIKNLMPYMQKFKNKIKNCLNHDIKETFSNIPEDSMELRSLRASANTSNREKLKKYLKDNIHISADITIDIDMEGKIEPFVTVNEETNLLGGYAGTCIENIFREVTFCPASNDENASLYNGFSLEMVYHYQQNVLISEDSDKDSYYKVKPKTSYRALSHSCKCCGSTYSVPLGQSCRTCSCRPPKEPAERKNEQKKLGFEILD